jgi:hypothetical protein
MYNFFSYSLYVTHSQTWSIFLLWKLVLVTMQSACSMKFIEFIVFTFLNFFLDFYDDLLDTRGIPNCSSE